MRRGMDSNPRDRKGSAGFQDRCIQPGSATPPRYAAAPRRYTYGFTPPDRYGFETALKLQWKPGERPSIRDLMRDRERSCPFSFRFCSNRM